MKILLLVVTLGISLNGDCQNLFDIGFQYTNSGIDIVFNVREELKDEQLSFFILDSSGNTVAGGMFSGIKGTFPIQRLPTPSKASKYTVWLSNQWYTKNKTFTLFPGQDFEISKTGAIIVPGTKSESYEKDRDSKILRGRPTQWLSENWNTQGVRVQKSGSTRYRR